MHSYEWIMYAAMAVWAGMGCYAALLGRRQAALSRRIKGLEIRQEDE